MTNRKALGPDDPPDEILMIPRKLQHPWRGKLCNVIVAYRQLYRKIVKTKLRAVWLSCANGNNENYAEEALQAGGVYWRLAPAKLGAYLVCYKLHETSLRYLKYNYRLLANEIIAHAGAHTKSSRVPSQQNKYAPRRGDMRWDTAVARATENRQNVKVTL